ncbi:MAG: hypothetical protein JXQ68_07355 [Campylobacterales bacterium]|nr:hypothetical protein [Campylobacterales bacterium]
MNIARVRFALLAVLFPLFLYSYSPIIKNELLKPEVELKITQIGTELLDKCGINGYIIATNDPFPRGYSMTEYLKNFGDSLSEPYIVFVFAPHDKRVGIVASSKELENLYDESSVEDAAIGVVATHDSNTLEDKYNIAILQGFSELADQVAHAKGVMMINTIPNDTKQVVHVLQYIIYIGSLLVFWIFIGRPIFLRIKNGRKK